MSETDNGRTYTPSYFLTDHLGSTRAIVDSEGVIADRSNYFPFGLRWDDAGSQISDNRWLYNGKEMQTAGLPDGASYLDYGARMYLPRLGRWQNPDPLAEKYANISSYGYCANNPIRYIDPNGMEIAGDTTAVNNLESQAQRGVVQEKRTQTRLMSKAERKWAKGKSTTRLARRYAGSKFRESQYQSTINEIGVLRASDNIYMVNTNFSSSYSDGEASYGGTNAAGNHIININVSGSYASNGGLAHELVHGYQFEIGQLDFATSEGERGLLYDIGDEVSAFTRQYVFTGNSNMYSVTPSYVRGITNSSGIAIYERLPSGSLNINTPYGMLALHHRWHPSINPTPYHEFGSQSGYIYNR